MDIATLLIGFLLGMWAAHVKWSERWINHWKKWWEE